MCIYAKSKDMYVFPEDCGTADIKMAATDNKQQPKHM